MALQLSINEGKRNMAAQSTGDVAVWMKAQVTTMANRMRGAASQVIARIKVAQAQGNKRKQMKLVESLALGNRRQLLLVVCDNQRYLVGAGADSVGSILAMDAGVASRDRVARGPELVRRRGRETSQEARSKAAESGLDLWH